MPRSVKVLKVPVLAPPEEPQTIVAPPEVSGFPLASLAVTVAVTELPETTVPEETLMLDALARAGPGTKLTSPPAPDTGVKRTKLFVSAFVEAKVHVEIPLPLVGRQPV